MSGETSRHQGVSGNFLVVVSMAIFGTYPLFLGLLPHINQLSFLFAFQIVGAIGFLALIGRRADRNVTPRTFMLLAVLAVVAIGNDAFYFAAFRNTTVANATISHQSVSIFLLFLAPLLLKEKTEKAEWYSLAPALLGVVIIYADGTSLGSQDLIGITFGILSGFFYAMVIVMYKILSDQEDLNIREINFGRLFLSSLLLLPFISQFQLESIQKQDLLPLIGFGLLFALIAGSIHSYAISISRSLHASILGKTEPVFAIIYGMIFLSEIPTPYAITGGFLIIGTSIWLAFQQNEQSKVDLIHRSRTDVTGD